MDRSALRLAALASTLALVSACAPPPAADAPPPAATAESQPATILAGSTPADGATLSRPPESLVLRFSRPARLHEVTVAGSDGTLTPVMVTAVGEVERYSVPLPELEPGAYEAAWRAESAGRTYRGVIRFTLR